MNTSPNKTGAWRNFAPKSTNPGELIRFRVNAMEVATREIASRLPALLRGTFGSITLEHTWDAYGKPCAVSGLEFDMEAVDGATFSEEKWLEIRSYVALEIEEQTRYQYYDAI